MEDASKIKNVVREKYSKIALQEQKVNSATCCGATSSSEKVYNIMQDDYSEIEGYQPKGDLGLGCGLPTEFAKVSKGDTVIDLGSGAGNDCFIARHETGKTGKVIGIDFTEAMLKKARLNTEKLGFNNVEFRFGDIEDIPVSDNVADVVVSNCVLNLVPNKEKVFTEIYRVLKPGGHFSISDIVIEGNLPDALKRDAEMYAGCISGAIQKDVYLGLIEKSGFKELQLQKEKVISIPDDILSKYLDEKALINFKKGDIGIFSITVYADKPKKSENSQKSKNKEECCEPGTGCC
ncbi:MAG: arsenite methyltransferase [Bacteroidota bacterium]